MVIIRPGDIALMAFVFARYAQAVIGPLASGLPVYASTAVIGTTLVNALGVKEGKWTQNVLTTVKALGLLAIVGAALLAPPAPRATPEPTARTMPGLQLALILVLFTYGGWNEIAYIAEEVKRPERNIVRALVLGTTVVTVLYVLVNGAFLGALGYARMTASPAVAVDTVATVLPAVASRAISALICVSALGAVNGLVFTGSRISYALGAEHVAFRRLGRWSARRGTPFWALIAQGGLSLVIILVAGSFVDTILYTAPVVWMFFLATALSVFVLRRSQRNRAHLEAAVQMQRRAPCLAFPPTRG